MDRDGPDKGHAWIIAIVAAVITMILSGISKMVGILYVAVIETYGASRQQASLPFIFRKSLRCLAGPLVGIIGQRYGIRFVTVIGAVIAALGAALCFIAPTVAWLAVCWGGIHGLGEAFSNTLFQVVVNQYFEIYLSTASGIALSGACLGSVCFSFLIEVLLDEYGLQGTFLILAGVILNVIPAAIFLKSPRWLRNADNVSTKNFKHNIKEDQERCTLSSNYVKINSEKKANMISLNTTSVLAKKEIENITSLPYKCYSAINLAASQGNKSRCKHGCENLKCKTEYESSAKKKPSLDIKLQDIFDESKKSLYYSIPSIYDLRNEPSLKKSETDKAKINIQKNSGNSKQSTLENIKSMIELFRNPVFLLICICQATSALTFVPVMTSIVDYSKDKGLPKIMGKYIIHSMAAGDILGRLGFGWVTDKEYISIPRYITITLVLEGGFIIALPFIFSIAGFLILLALFCMATGSMLVRLPVMLLKHVKIEEHLIAIGCYVFVSGLIPLLVPCLIGYFRDHVGSYDGMYFLIGSCSIVSGGLWFLEPFLTGLK